MLSTTENGNVPSRQHYSWVAFALNSLTVTRSASKPAAVNSSSDHPSQGSLSTLKSPVIPTMAQRHGFGVASVCWGFTLNADGQFSGDTAWW